MKHIITAWNIPFCKGSMFKYENLWVARFYSAEPVTFLKNILYYTYNFMCFIRQTVCVCSHRKKESFTATVYRMPYTNFLCCVPYNFIMPSSSLL